MNFLNKAQIIGNVTRDPEVKQTKNGIAVCTVGVATNRRWKTKGDSPTGDDQFHEEAEYHNVVCWGRLAEIVGQYVKRGSKVFFEGRLQTRSWEDDAGIKHYRTEIVAQDMIMLDKKSKSDDLEAMNAPDEDEIPAEDLPF